MEIAIRKQMETVGYMQRLWENILKTGKEKRTRSFLNARLELLESYWTRFLSRHDELSSFDGINDSPYKKNDVYTEAEDSYLEMKTRISTCMQTPKEAARAVEDSSSVLRHRQLPTQNLPQFDGDQLAWVSFRDLFKSLVHDVEGLPSVQKLQYLKACLKGEAAEVVDNIEMTADGYALAWEELRQRYDNRRVLLAAHMRALLSAPAMTKSSAYDINRLITVVKRASRTFQSLGRPVEHWDDWFVHILVEKLDSATKLWWESSRKASEDFPSFQDLEQFLHGRKRGLEAVGSRSPQRAAPTVKPKQSGRRSDVSSHATSTSSDKENKGVPCPLCREQHSLRYCAKFKALSVEQRRDHTRKKRACFNCLGQNHTASACPSMNRCRLCNKKHHTLLHFTGTDRGRSTSRAPSTSLTQRGTSGVKTDTPAAEDVSQVATHTSSTRGTVLLATAMVTLIAPSGKSVEVRALLDSGSEASFVTERMTQLLGLKRRRVGVTVSGMQGVTTGTAKHSVSLIVSTRRLPAVRIPLTRALVLAKLTPLTPGHRIPRGSWPHLQGLYLADPQFHVPSQIDVVLGADVYGMLLDNGFKRGLPGEPSAHLTVFGWVLMGAIGQPEDISSMRVAVHHAAVNDELHQTPQRFWELESVPSDRILTPEEAHCEEHFVNTHSRDAAKRYMVRLPKKEDASVVLGSSRVDALRVLQGTERRTEQDPTTENPADAATRGLTPAELAQHNLWWTGPPWLKLPAESWPDEALSVPDNLEEVRTVATTGIGSREDNDLLTRFSSLTRLIGISVYCLRFKRGRIKSDFLITDELKHSLRRWLQIVQLQDFSSELKALEKGDPLPRKSAVLALRPFLGTDGLIRVGGRLRNSSLQYGERHPVTLSKDSYLSQLLVRDAHSRTLHGGIQLTRSVLARHYWIVHANCLIRAVIHRCVQCVRFRGQTLTQQMGQLPCDRMRAARPFKATGVDFAGPVFLRSSSGRGHKSYKGYICLFVCMATKAIHLEAVSGLTSALFIAAYIAHARLFLGPMVKGISTPSPANREVETTWEQPPDGSLGTYQG